MLVVLSLWNPLLGVDNKYNHYHYLFTTCARADFRDLRRIAQRDLILYAYHSTNSSMKVGKVAFCRIMKKKGDTNHLSRSLLKLFHSEKGGDLNFLKFFPTVCGRVFTQISL